MNFLFGPPSRLLVLLLVLTGVTSSCSPIGLPLGGGPNVAANTQIGRENTQTIGQDKRFQPELRTEGPIETVEQSSNDIKTGSVENLQITNIPFWVVLLLILGWLLPTPTQIAQSFLDLFRRKK